MSCDHLTVLASIVFFLAVIRNSWTFGFQLLDGLLAFGWLVFFFFELVPTFVSLNGGEGPLKISQQKCLSLFYQGINQPHRQGDISTLDSIFLILWMVAAAPLFQKTHVWWFPFCAFETQSQGTTKVNQVPRCLILTKVSL